MVIERTRVLEESWAADQIRNEPEGVLGSAIRAVATGAANEPAVSISMLPVLGNNRQRWQTSVYQTSNVLTSRDGTKQYAVVVREDMHQVVCVRNVGDPTWTQAIDLRSIGGDPFTEQALDSHNTFSMGEDELGNIHICGNLHADPLRYARTTTPGDLSTLTGFTPFAANANRVTYPIFYVDPSGAFCIAYRNGLSGDGDFFIARFIGGVWQAPVCILSGTTTSQGAYAHNMAVRDGKMGLFYCWRGTGDASTNERPGYIESLDNGTTWQTVEGVPVTLPVNRNSAPVILDVPVGSGLINQGGADLDTLGRPHAGFQMYDAAGITQLYHFWHNGQQWHVEQVTRWTHRVETVGVSTLDLQVSRVHTICTNAGRTYFVARTANEGFDGAPIMIDVTEGADRTPFKLMDVNLDGWEPAYDTWALRHEGKLTMLVTPVANSTNWTAQWLGVLTIDLEQIAAVQAGLARIPTIRTLRTYERSLQADAVGGTVEADVDRTVLPWGYISTRDTGKGQRLFARVTALVQFESGTTSASLYLQERPRIGSLPTADLAKMAFPNSGALGLVVTPWEPLRNSPYVETSGLRRDTALVPRLIADSSGGVELRTYAIEIGVLDWV